MSMNIYHSTVLDGKEMNCITTLLFIEQEISRMSPDRLLECEHKQLAQHVVHVKFKCYV